MAGQGRGAGVSRHAASEGIAMAQPPGMQLAHFNWATLVGDLGSPEVAPFEGAVPQVNALAERSPGFVWRHGDERGAGLSAGWPLFTENPRCIASFSLWESAAQLRGYVHATVHGAFFRRRAEWFLPDRGGHVLWWVPAGHVPDIAEARDRVEAFGRDGPGDAHFTLAHLALGASSPVARS